jgi:uncharacterized protein YciI
VLFAIHCLDGDDAAERRAELGAEHSARLRTSAPRPLVCGPLLSDDGDAWLGTAALVRAAGPGEAGALLTADRYAAVEVHSTAAGGRPS